MVPCLKSIKKKKEKKKEKFEKICALIYCVFCKNQWLDVLILDTFISIKITVFNIPLVLIKEKSVPIRKINWKFTFYN